MEAKKEPTRIEAKDGAKGTHAHVTVSLGLPVWPISLNHIKRDDR